MFSSMALGKVHKMTEILKNKYTKKVVDKDKKVVFVGSQAGFRARKMELDLPRGTEIKFAFLEKISEVLARAEKNKELDKGIEQVKKFLVDELACSEEVAAGYIKAALDCLG